MKILQVLSMYHPEGEKILTAGAEVIRTDRYDIPHLVEMVKDVDGIILRAPAKITKEIIKAAPKLKVISGAGVGVDNIDVGYATKKKIPVLHAPSINAISTAEHTVLLIMALAKSLIPFHLSMKKGDYDSRMHRKSFELRGKRVGIIGFGSIAKEVAKRISALEMDATIWVRKYDETKHDLAKKLGMTITTDLDTVFRESDFITIHIPLTTHTEKLINKHHFNLMKDTAYFINTARGAIVNHTDLYAALSTKEIAGAALDVFDPEPPPKNSSLLSLENIIVTPHIAGTTEECNYIMSTTLAKNLLRVLNGKKVSLIVNPEVWRKP